MPIHYPNAPITEAIVDLRVELEEGFELARLKDVGDTVKSEYPKQEEMVESGLQFAVGPDGGSASLQRKTLGTKFVTVDGKQIFQSRLNGFTFSRLAPYDRWEPFRDDARRLWKAFRDVTAPAAVTRLAVRYINRIDIPGDKIDLKDYLRTSPEIAPELPQMLEGYFMQLQLPFSELAGRCLINQTIVPPAREDVVSVVLDIDLFRDRDVPQDEETIWRFFETLHDEKNNIFEACITDSTRKLFE